MIAIWLRPPFGSVLSKSIKGNEVDHVVYSVMRPKERKIERLT